MTKTKAAATGRASLLLCCSMALAACGGRAPSDQLGASREALVSTISCPVGFSDVVAVPPGALAFVPLAPLASAPNPIFPRNPATGLLQLRPDLAAYYVRDVQAAIQLGKALFWDVQAGSDNRTACATCHFAAGADIRSRNQLNPGANGTFDGASTNYQLTAADYPFVAGVAGALTRNVDNVAGSAGVRAAKFKGVTGAVESTAASTAIGFGTMRQVTGVNTPTALNAVFNHRNFWNGRAQPDFNGVNPWGARDALAKPWTVDASGNVVPWKISIPNASLASQAVGPPVSSVEMSAAGRTFPDIGVKLLASKPLGLQTVDPTDSVLGPLAVAGGKGLSTTYAALIQQAFYPSWWNTAKLVKIGTKSYTLTQANFSMFWGIAIMLYEAKLVSDATPMDGYVATRFDPATGLPRVVLDPVTGAATLSQGDPTRLQPFVDRLNAQGFTIPDPITGAARPFAVGDVLAGLALFEEPVPPPGTLGLPPGSGAGCAFCHFGAETTSASVRNLTAGLEVGAGEFTGAGFDLRMERMFMGLRSPAPAPLPGYWPTPPQPPPPVPRATDVITYDDATYKVTVTSVAGKAVPAQVAPVSTYDVGWYNVGVRPSAENAGIGGLDFASKPLSWVQYFQQTLPDPTVVLVPGGGLGCVDPATGNPIVPPAAPLNSAFAGQVLDPVNGFPLLSGRLQKTEATDVAGSFKTSSLRNVELDGPYFHTGAKATLRQVIDLYDDGGHFANASLAPFIRPLGLTAYQADALVAFLLALTDERVRTESAPFDHPELPLPVGQDAAGADVLGLVPAIGSAGHAAPVPVRDQATGATLFYMGARFLDLNPFQL